MVFLAKDLTNEVLVAIKCLLKSTQPDGVQAASSNDNASEPACHDHLGYHPNLVNLLHSFETGSHVYLVLEFCSMGDLYEAIRLGRGPLETEHVRDFMLQLINAVDYMHSKGFYHRDIKPENIFLTQDGSMKLGDFGLATSDSWSFEASVGSDRYMAPEQYDPADSGYSPASADIWAIGICLLNILFARNPFVKPAESDVLYVDFVRDRQSLFDVFPNMSQDTFEILIHALAIDPKKRSLSAVRDALERVISFTTDDEVLDDFCTDSRDVIPASANREPLRTPSIQNSTVDQDGHFPWSQVLHKSPVQPVRQLSAIPDTESYYEDLFPASEKDRNSWYSVAAQTPSLASVLDSTLGASVKSMALRQPAPRNPPRPSKESLSGSLPVSASKPVSAMSMIFGKKDTPVSKSWSDLWDEDEEGGLTEQERALEQRRQFNSRTWSQESKDEDITIGRSGLSEVKNPSLVNTRTRSPEQEQDPIEIHMDGVNENEDFFHDFPNSRNAPVYSPPSKRTIMDKWAVLGNRRRAAHPEIGKTAQTGQNAKNNTTWRRGFGLRATTGNITAGLWDRKQVNGGGGGSKVLDWRRDNHYPHHPNNSADEDGDVEWVGGWHNFHL
ncbi:hypothetical protein MMC20_002850 [Loxospora ochrophaea]|nr:hypothetical protein [Loxospora ochrophaea]